MYSTDSAERAAVLDDALVARSQHIGVDRKVGGGGGVA